MKETMEFKWWALVLLLLVIFLVASAKLVRAHPPQQTTMIYLPLIQQGQSRVSMGIYVEENVDNSVTDNALGRDRLLSAMQSDQHRETSPAQRTAMDSIDQELATTNMTGWLPLSPNMSRVEYAAQCAAEMGTIPAFSCLDGQAIPIKLHGEAQTHHVDQCDDPAQLGLSSDGQCVPGTRTGTLSTGNPDVTTIFICRKYYDDPSPIFHDIAVIQHNRATGNTCWSQSPPDVAQNGTTVPSPMENSSAANQFWLEPSSVSAINCQRCHDADPFIWTPYIGQVVGQFPSTWDPKGDYVANAFGIFGSQPQARIFNPTGNHCVSCHRIGEYTVNGSNGAVPLVERAVFLKVDQNDVDNHTWMPPSGPIYILDVFQLLACGNDPALADCNTQLPVTPFAKCTGTLYIDKTHIGFERGTSTNPFRTVGAAYKYACNGAQLKIKAGNYPESLIMNKHVTLLSQGGTVTIGK